MKENSNKMYNYTCNYCLKQYIRQSAFNSHLEKCKFHRLCRTTQSTINNDISSSTIEEDINIKSVDININSLYKLLIQLYNKYQKLESDYNEIKKYVNITKKKINILEYLNTHERPEIKLNLDSHSESDFDFNDFICNIDITFIELNLIFKYDYIDGIYNIIINHIEKYKTLDHIVPIKSFKQKENLIYIFTKESDSWNIMDNEYINLLLKYFDKKLLLLFLDWKIQYESSMDNEQFSQIYVLNMKKVIGANFTDKNKNKTSLLRGKLYKYLAQDIRILNECCLEFEIDTS